MDSKIVEHEAIPFLKSLYRNCEDGMLNLRFLPKGKNEFISVNNFDKVPSIISRYPEQNVHFGIALRSGKDGTKQGVLWIPALWMDHDTVTPGVEKRIKEFPLRPSIVVQTSIPTKRQYYWLLKEPLSKEHILKVEDTNQRIANYLGGDLNACDASRILRLAGTFNFKYNQPLPCKVLEINDGNEYLIEDFEILPLVEVGKERKERNWRDDLLPGVSEGQRNAAAAQLVGSYLAKGLLVGEILDLLTTWNLRNRPPLDKSELQSVIESVKKTHDRESAKKEDEGQITNDVGSKKRAPLIEVGVREEEVIIHKERVLPKFPEETLIGVFKDWEDLVCSGREVGESFSFGTFIAVLGLVFGRDFYLIHPDPIFMNFYVLLVGMSSETHKSSALRCGKRFLKAIGDNTVIMGAPVSAEKLCEILGQERGTKVLSYINEIRVYLYNAERGGTRNLLPHIDELYDCPEDFHLPGLSEHKAKDPFFSIVAGSVREVHTEKLGREMTYAGSLNRFNIFLGEDSKIVAHGRKISDNEIFKFSKKVVELKKELKKGGGEMSWTKEGYDYYEEWYNGWKSGRGRLHDSIRSLTGRVNTHVDKYSMLFALTRGSMKINESDVEKATRVADYNASCCVEIFRDIAVSKMAGLERKILRYYEDGPKERRWVQQRIGGNCSCEEFNRAFDAICKSGLLSDCKVKSGSGKEVTMHEKVGV